MLVVNSRICRYYVRHCNKPKNRAALALAVNIGSIVEEDDEQGLAHVVEHLAFNATQVCSMDQQSDHAA